MKLKTEMVHMDGKWSVGVVSGFSDEAQARARKDVSHDAMAARALLQAMGEVVKEYPYASALSCRGLTMRRADEILAGWLGEEAG